MKRKLKVSVRPEITLACKKKTNTEWPVSSPHYGNFAFFFGGKNRKKHALTAPLQLQGSCLPCSLCPGGYSDAWWRRCHKVWSPIHLMQDRLAGPSVWSDVAPDLQICLQIMYKSNSISQEESSPVTLGSGKGISDLVQFSVWVFCWFQLSFFFRCTRFERKAEKFTDAQILSCWSSTRLHFQLPFGSTRFLSEFLPSLFVYNLLQEWKIIGVELFTFPRKKKSRKKITLCLPPDWGAVWDTFLCAAG